MLLPVGRVRENAEKQTDSKIGIRQQEYLRGISLVPILSGYSGAGDLSTTEERA